MTTGGAGVEPYAAMFIPHVTLPFRNWRFVFAPTTKTVRGGVTGLTIGTKMTRGWMTEPWRSWRGVRVRTTNGRVGMMTPCGCDRIEMTDPRRLCLGVFDVTT
jgi:hypothetical protein